MTEDLKFSSHSSDEKKPSPEPLSQEEFESKMLPEITNALKGVMEGGHTYALTLNGNEVAVKRVDNLLDHHKSETFYPIDADLAYMWTLGDKYHSLDTALREEPNLYTLAAADLLDSSKLYQIYTDELYSRRKDFI